MRLLNISAKENILELRRRKQRETGQTYIIRSFSICTLVRRSGHVACVGSFKVHRNIQKNNLKERKTERNRVVVEGIDFIQILKYMLFYRVRCEPLVLINTTNILIGEATISFPQRTVLHSVNYPDILEDNS